MKVTYEQLVKIVRKTIEILDAEKLEAEMKEAEMKAAAVALRVASFSFDDKNKDLIRRAFASMGTKMRTKMRTNMGINIGAGPNFVDAENLETLDVCDILFVDYLPSGLIPKLALGIDEAPFSACFNRMILNGCKIFVLKSDPAESEKTPTAFRELLAGYRQTLKSYGYIFFNYMFFNSGVPALPGQNTQKTPQSAKDADFVFNGSVFCRDDLYRYAPGGNAVLGKDVRVTPMALDCAKDMNITIMRL
jgi:hypothetical protein